LEEKKKNYLFVPKMGGGVLFPHLPFNAKWWVDMGGFIFNGRTPTGMTANAAIKMDGQCADKEEGVKRAVK
jgi:hypothetical protein